MMKMVAKEPGWNTAKSQAGSRSMLACFFHGKAMVKEGKATQEEAEK